jgi:uncharacterized integral membrane protein (TIGR00698 family)
MKDQNNKMTTSKSTSFLPPQLKINEDWLAVWVGAGLIGLMLLGLRVESPDFSWGIGGIEGIRSRNSSKIFGQFVVACLSIAIAMPLMGKKIWPSLKVFCTVFLLTLLALILGGNQLSQQFNLEAVIFSLGIGLLVGNLFNLPQWFKEHLSSELYVKIGLVLLGSSVIFGDILKAGSLGLIQALVVVLSVWYFAFYLCKWLKVDSEMTMMIASAVSICGVSAAIATSGAIKGDPKKLSYVISMVLITAIPMMLLMPPAAQWMGLSQEVTGAWLGGSIDTSGAVVASGSLVGETALQISTIVKFSQNVLLGLAAFAISLYWSYTQSPEAKDPEKKPTLRVIWERFPKFVIGFIGASLLFSFLVSGEVYAEVKGSLKGLQQLWFALAFTGIGLETNFKDLFQVDNHKPLISFLTAQVFNILVTLLLAILLFS